MSLEMEKSMSTFAARPAIAPGRLQGKNHRRARVARPPKAELAPVLSRYYDAMSSTLGPMRWWPAKTPFEVIVGAILTQNTAWTNVEKAIDNLRQVKLLTPAALAHVSQPRLARLIRSSGYFRQKARKLKAFVGFLRRGYGGSLARMFRQPTAALREELLGVHGIGPETADSILLYAGNHPVFVVDAYTRRILTRHGVMSEKSAYEEIRLLFETNLPRDPKLWNEYHALVVNVGKNWCRNRNPRCEECPLRPFLPAETLATLQIESPVVTEHSA
jgi:endonuclease-3 related protein